MAERREADDFRTDRPSPITVDESHPSVREVLAVDAVADGLPEVLANETGLDARVRWVHVSDSADVARLLNGGELLLSTGSGWPAEPAELDAFVAGLVAAGVSGLVLELGVHYRYVPAIIVDAARRHGLTLVVLHREVKFVALTEAVHRRIISEQTAALRARDDVREQFTALALRGSPADFVVHRLAQTLGAAVVLENLAHEVVTAEMSPADEEVLLPDWEARSRAAHQLARDAEQAGLVHDDRWLIVPVEARGIRWGHLIALPGPAHPAGRSAVLEQGAIALAVGRLADGDVDEWARIGRQRLLDRLLAGRFGGAAAAAARVEAAGLPLTGAQVVGVVVSGVDLTAGEADAAARTLRGRALAAPLLASQPATVVLLSLPAGTEFDDRAAREYVRVLRPGAAQRLELAIGTPGDGLESGLASLREAIDLARSGDARPGRGPVIRRAVDRPLVRLVSSLRDDHRLLEHGERMLRPLVEHDLRRHGDLLDVLGAVLAHPANRTAAATASHLSRSVFYQRLAQIQDLLGADLDDGETQTALHLALLVRRSAGR
ncbi:PucR family transcriptional regulator [Agromyces silvae]|uniref:PucR family transcriptional regulator n=1 Tax=Agromyces silvae TaxID=3388266 RepID=UPI00280AEA1F|nr:PucR family transcriptional regulator [Agromyces protaetiae]